MAGLQQKHIAVQLGFANTATLRNWEREQTMPNGTNLIKLCILYGKTPEELYPQYYQKVEKSLKE